MTQIKSDDPLDTKKIKTSKELFTDAKDIIQHNWEEVKIKISDRWNEFTTHDIIMIKGKAEDLCTLLQKKYLYSKERAEREISKFIEDHGWKHK